jgi:hypothetical protein
MAATNVNVKSSLSFFTHIKGDKFVIIQSYPIQSWLIPTHVLTAPMCDLIDQCRFGKATADEKAAIKAMFTCPESKETTSPADPEKTSVEVVTTIQNSTKATCWVPRHLSLCRFKLKFDDGCINIADAQKLFFVYWD